MTMTSSDQSIRTSGGSGGGGGGWFDSLRRNRRNKSLGSSHSIATNVSTHQMSGAKSMSSLTHTHLTVIHDSPPPPGSADAKSRSWRSLLPHRHHKNKIESASSASASARALVVVEPVPLPVADVDKSVSSSSSTSPSTVFWTLPRKRAVVQNKTDNGGDGSGSGRPPVSSSSRSRSYSIASLERRNNKRSTVWYTHSDGDILGNRNRRVSEQQHPSISRGWLLLLLLLLLVVSSVWPRFFSRKRNNLACLDDACLRVDQS